MEVRGWRQDHLGVRKRLTVQSEGGHRVRLESEVGIKHCRDQGEVTSGVREKVTLWSAMRGRFQ